MPGVIVRDKYLQIDLRAHGFGRERLELQPTPANIRHAERMRAEILGKIERGTFVLGDYFPDSPRARADVPSMTVGQLFGEWLDVKKPELQHSTIHSYQQTIDSYHFDGVRRDLVGNFTFRSLKRLLARLPANPKTFNNVASVLRQVLEYGYKAKILAEPLHESIEMRRRQKPEPDPFTLDEVEVLLGQDEGGGRQELLRVRVLQRPAPVRTDRPHLVKGGFAIRHCHGRFRADARASEGHEDERGPQGRAAWPRPPMRWSASGRFRSWLADGCFSPWQAENWRTRICPWIHGGSLP